MPGIEYISSKSGILSYKHDRYLKCDAVNEPRKGLLPSSLHPTVIFIAARVGVVSGLPVATVS